MKINMPGFSHWRLPPLDRRIMTLALPALGALIAEPLFLLADSIMVGQLGGQALAGLGLAGAVLQTIVGLMVFLAYGATPAVARRLGQGDQRGALAVGIDGLWLALALGLALAATGALLSPQLIAAFAPDPAVASEALSYLRWSMAGLPAMLLVFAASGLLRGLQDTQTPLRVAGIGFAVNIVLNYLFMYVLHWGIAGAAIGSVLAQWGMVAVYLLIINRQRQGCGTRWWPHWQGIKLGVADGGWLFLRTLSLRSAILLTVQVATRQGPTELAAFHIALTLFNTLAFALDALAIAAQALIGHRLGAGKQLQARAILQRCLQWGLRAGVLLGLLVIAVSALLGPLFTADPAVHAVLPIALWILGLGVPLGALVWVLDGVLMGAGDLRYLGLTSLINLLLYLPCILPLLLLLPTGRAGIFWLMLAFCGGFLGARLTTLSWRIRSSDWVRSAAQR